MKLSTFLLCTLLISTAFCDDRHGPKNEALIQAVTSFNWSWESVFSGTKTFTDIQFYQGGSAQNPKYFSAHWEAIGPRTLRLVNTKAGGANEGNIAYLVFDADFTRYIGLHFDGKTIVEGARRESLDPARTPPEAEAQEDEPAKAGNDELIGGLTSFNWSWEQTTTGPKHFEEIQFYQGGFAQNPEFFTAQWEATSPHTFTLRFPDAGDDEGSTACFVFDAAFTHYIGIDFNGHTNVEGFRRQALDRNRPRPVADQ